jgi:antitoxin component of RelBE/YafQ-DinJ toxin-antitoxin module
MVKSLNITLDDETHAAATEVKEARGLTWREFIEVATEELDSD